MYLDIAIRQVADPTCQSKGRGVPFDERAEADALHTPCHDVPSGNQHIGIILAKAPS